MNTIKTFLDDPERTAKVIYYLEKMQDWEGDVAGFFGAISQSFIPGYKNISDCPICCEQLARNNENYGLIFGLLDASRGNLSWFKEIFDIYSKTKDGYFPHLLKQIHEELKQDSGDLFYMLSTVLDCLENAVKGTPITLGDFGAFVVFSPLGETAQPQHWEDLTFFSARNQGRLSYEKWIVFTELDYLRGKINAAGYTFPHGYFLDADVTEHWEQWLTANSYNLQDYPEDIFIYPRRGKLLTRVYPVSLMSVFKDWLRQYINEKLPEFLDRIYQTQKKAIYSLLDIPES